MKSQFAYFGELPKSTVFTSNGNIVQKTSTRSGLLIEYGRSFFFGRNELVIVGEHSRLVADYFS